MGRKSAIRVLIASRDYPVSGQHGSGMYLIDFARYLHDSGFKVTYLFFGALPLNYDQLHHLGPELAGLMRVVAPGHVTIGSVGLPRPRSWVGWGGAALRPVYNRLPQHLRRLYRALGRPAKELASVGNGAQNSDNAKLALRHDSLPSDMEIAVFRQTYGRTKPDIVIADYVWMAPLLDEIPGEDAIVKVILTKDVLHSRVADFARAGIDSGHTGWTRAQESALLRKGEILVAIQAEEASLLAQMAPEADVVCAPLSVRPKTGAGQQVLGRCLFVGSRGQHNVHGLSWFLEQVWPRILNTCPDASLHVCGSVAEGVPAGAPRVSFLGLVPDLGPEYSQAQVCLAPLLVGSGLKIKLIEALAYGRAGVGTSTSLQGIQELGGRAVLVADTPDAFAAAVVTVLSDAGVRGRLESEARLLAATRFSPEQCYQPFVERVRAHLAQAGQS